MKAKSYLVLLMGFMLFSGCGKDTDVVNLDDCAQSISGDNKSEVQESVTESVPTEQKVEPVIPKPEINDAHNAKARTVYQKALISMMDNLKLPNGTALNYDTSFAFSQNKYAVADVDCDGKEELLILYTTGPMAAMGDYVYGYDEETGELYEEFSDFSMKFYDNGVLISEMSHNHGRGDKLWPYTVYYYNSDADKYSFGFNVDSWEKDYYGDKVGGVEFPSDVDEDGDGILYYLQEYDDYSYSNPIDGSEYQAWYERVLDGAKEISPEYYAMTKENVAAITF